MPVVSSAAVRRQIRSGETGPVYLVCGEDEVEKGRLAAEFAEAVEEDLRAFNVERLYGGEATVRDVLDAARTLPMMGARRVVIVLRAEKMLEPKRDTEAAARDLEALGQYIASPEPHATVVFVAASLNGSRRITKTLRTHAAVIECGGLETSGDAMAWVRSAAVAAKLQLEPEAIRLLVERAGPDIARLRADLERLGLYAGRGRITTDDVLAVMGQGAPESRDPWALTNAIERGDAAAALRELALALEAGAWPLAIVGQLGWVVRDKLALRHRTNPAEAVDAVLRTDLALKTSGGNPRVLLERLVVELCDGARREGPGRTLRRR